MQQQQQTQLPLYADIIKYLAINKHDDELNLLVDEVITEVERDGGIKNGEDTRRSTKLVKSLVGARKGDVAMRVYGLMKRGRFVPGEYLFRYLKRGLRRLGAEEGTRVVEIDYEKWDLRGEWREKLQEEDEAIPV